MGVNGLSLMHVPTGMERDRELVLKAVPQNATAMQWVHPDFHDDLQVPKTAARQLTIIGHRLVDLTWKDLNKYVLIADLELRERESAQQLEAAHRTEPN